MSEAELENWVTMKEAQAHLGVRRETITKWGLRVKMCVWLGVSRGLDLAFLNAD